MTSRSVLIVQDDPIAKHWCTHSKPNASNRTQGAVEQTGIAVK
jgi:hypothetical protein